MVKQAPAGKYGDGGGLWLIKSGKDTGSWMLRVSVHGRLKHMGLGSIADVSLKEARDAAERWRKVARAGTDPINDRRRQKREAARNMHLLKDVADDCFEAIKATLKGDGTAGRWRTPLDLHVLPKLGKIPVAELTQDDIKNVLRPLRDTKHETMRKALNRLNLVVRHAAAAGLDVDLQVVDKARALIGASQHKAENVPAMAWADVPGFYASLSDGSVTHLALRLLILTGVRSAPLRFMREDQIDGKVWTIPAALMKSRKGKADDFRVPLSAEAIVVIDQAKRHARGGYLFPNASGKGVISDMTLSMYMRRAKIEARPHGFRSSLRDWLADCTDAPHEVAETILGHAVGSAVTRAYLRTDFLDQRRALLERWANHCIGKATTDDKPAADDPASNVVPMRART
ncbi:site-specific integrase [Mesorhizobium sp. M00.F.Ca.ET.158.01.1.1]|nr:site-specific integrase [Mesorhizobium sp. M00.F.Ca.ET.158.01.1.1]